MKNNNFVVVLKGNRNHKEEYPLDATAVDLIKPGMFVQRNAAGNIIPAGAGGHGPTMVALDTDRLQGKTCEEAYSDVGASVFCYFPKPGDLLFTRGTANFPLNGPVAPGAGGVTVSVADGSTVRGIVEEATDNSGAANALADDAWVKVRFK